MSDTRMKPGHDKSSKEKLKAFFGKMPISINNLYGDPFIPLQREDTFYKLSRLMEESHLGPISIITKYKIDSEVLKRLAEYQEMKNLIFFYSLTGFDEGGTPFKGRMRAFSNLAKLMPNVVLLYRPIIAGQNDKPEIIKKMVRICKRQASRLYILLYTQ